jgi:hypothetical protein
LIWRLRLGEMAQQEHDVDDEKEEVLATVRIIFWTHEM